MHHTQTTNKNVCTVRLSAGPSSEHVHRLRNHQTGNSITMIYIGVYCSYRRWLCDCVSLWVWQRSDPAFFFWGNEKWSCISTVSQVSSDRSGGGWNFILLLYASVQVQSDTTRHDCRAKRTRAHGAERSREAKSKRDTTNVRTKRRTTPCHRIPVPYQRIREIVHTQALFSSPKNQKVFKISRHIEFCGTYMKH